VTVRRPHEADDTVDGKGTLLELMAKELAGLKCQIAELRQPEQVFWEKRPLTGKFSQMFSKPPTDLAEIHLFVQIS